ncbi:MAG: MauE/DoxX family redox-associated membrane protein [Planctomycetaceae bacterium]
MNCQAAVRHGIVRAGIAGLCGWFFVLAAVGKAIPHRSWQGLLFDWKAFAVLVAAVESTLGILMMVRRTRAIGVQLASGFLALSSLFIVLQFVTGSTQRCGCYGGWIEIPPAVELIVNGVVLALLALPAWEAGT